MGKRASARAPVAVDPTLAASSAVQRRAIEIYRASVPAAGPVLDERVWRAAVRQARVEIEGVEP